MNISLTKPIEEAEQKLDRNINTGLEEANQGLGTEFNSEFADKLVEKVQMRIDANQEK